MIFNSSPAKLGFELVASSVVEVELLDRGANTGEPEANERQPEHEGTAGDRCKVFRIVFDRANIAIEALWV